MQLEVKETYRYSSTFPLLVNDDSSVSRDKQWIIVKGEILWKTAVRIAGTGPGLQRSPCGTHIQRYVPESVKSGLRNIRPIQSLNYEVIF